MGVPISESVASDHQLVRIRTMVKNGLHAIAKDEASPYVGGRTRAWEDLGADEVGHGHLAHRLLGRHPPHEHRPAAARHRDHVPVRLGLSGVAGEFAAGAVAGDELG